MLNPNLAKGDYWTAVRELRLFKEFKAIGSHWSKIACKFPGQSENSIKNRFYSILRKTATRVIPAEKKKRRASMYTQSELI